MSTLLSPVRAAAASWRFVLALLLLLGCVQTGSAASRTIAYQGFLSTPAGAPLNANVALTFRIYRDASGSERLWTERHPAVPVRAGLFLVALGSIEPLDNAPALFEVGDSLYVSIEVGEDGEMTPRLPLGVAPYALAASATRSASTTVDCTADEPETIAAALARAPAGGEYTITLVGTCEENVVIARNNVVIQGNGTAKILGVIMDPPPPTNAVIYIDGARSVLLRGVTVEGAEDDKTGMRGVVVDNGASGGLVDNAVVHKVGDVGVLVIDNSTWDIQAQVRDTGSIGVLVEGNSHVDLQDAVVERPGLGSRGLTLRIHSSGTMLRSTVRSVDANAVFVDDASTLRIEADNLIESAIKSDNGATMAVYRGSAVRVYGAGSVIRNTNPISYTEGGANRAAAGGQALDVEMKSTFTNLNGRVTLEGWIQTYNLSTVDLRNATINGHLHPGGLRDSIRLSDQSSDQGRVTLNGNVRLGGGFYIATGSDAAIINGDVDCRGGRSVTGSIQFKDPEDGYINCWQFNSDLAVTFTNSTDPTVVDQTANYTAEIVNETLSPAVEAVNAWADFSLSGAAATILDAAILNAAGSGGTCSFTATTASCSLGRVRTGSPITVSLSVRRDAPGAIIKQVTVGAQNTDPDSSDNTVSVGGGTIAGTVTDAGTGLGVPNVDVEIFDAGGNWVTSVFTDANGNYTTGAGLAAGSYLARTSNSGPLIAKLYNDISCTIWCSITTGTPITVTVGATSGGIDFALERGVTIAGTVTDAGTGLGAPNVSVQIYDAGGYYVTDGYTDASGNYTTNSGLAAGSYFARASNSAPLIGKLYNDIPCTDSCIVTAGTPITVTVGATTGGIDFALERGGTIAGTVTDASTGLGVPNVYMEIYNAGGNYVTDGYTDASGNYTSHTGLAAGSYFARTFNYAGLIDELYDGISCTGSCIVTAGTPISVTVGATTGGIDFALERGGTIAGTVTDEGTGLGVPNVNVQIFDASGNWVTSGDTDASGNYTTDAGLAAGSYFAQTFNSAPLIGKLYNDISCTIWCDITAGTPITVTVGATTGGIDFALERGGTITGTVTDAGTGLGVPNVSVQIFDADGNYVTDGYTDANGNYTTGAGLAAGSYFARTRNSGPLIAKLYNDISCTIWCSITTGTPITVTVGATSGGIDFALERGGTIAGTVTDAGTGLGAPNVSVQIYDASGNYVTDAYTDTSGNYTTDSGLAAGSYFARTFNNAGLIDELYDDISCASSCIITEGTPITVTVGANTGGIDFALEN